MISPTIYLIERYSLLWIQLMFFFSSSRMSWSSTYTYISLIMSYLIFTGCSLFIATRCVDRVERAIRGTQLTEMLLYVIVVLVFHKVDVFFYFLQNVFYSEALVQSLVDENYHVFIVFLIFTTNITMNHLQLRPSITDRQRWLLLMIPLGLSILILLFIQLRKYCTKNKSPTPPSSLPLRVSF